MRSSKKTFNIRVSIIVLGVMTLFTFLNTNRYLSFSGSAVFFVLFLAFSVCEFVTNIGHPLSKSCLCSMCIMAYTFVSFLLTQNYKSISTAIVLSMFFLSSLSWGVFRFNKQEICFLEKCYILSLLIIELFMLLRPSLYSRLRGRYTLQVFNNTAIDPNFLAIYFVVGAVIILDNLKKATGQKFFFLLLFLIVTAFCIFATGSRGGMVGLLVALLVLYNKSLLEALKKRPVVVPLILAALLVGIVIAWAAMPDDIKARFFILENYYDGSNITRVIYWRNSVEAIKTHWLFGNGIIDFSQKHKVLFGIGGDAHNTYLAVLEIYGLFGSLPFCFFIFEEIKQSLRRKDQINMAILLSLSVMSFILDALVTFPLWIAVLYIHMRNFQKI